MIYIVHGDNYPKSRALITNQQKKLGIPKREELKWEDIPLERLEQIINEDTLFGDPKLVVITIDKQSKLDKAQEELLQKAKTKKTVTLIFLANKSLPKTNPFLKLHAKTIENNIKLEGNVFNFVEALFNRDRKRVYKEFVKLQQEKCEDFYILSMIQYGLRTIASIVFEAPSVKDMKQYTKRKYANMARKYTKTSLRDLYEYIYTKEVQAKTGQIPSDIWLTQIIEKVLNSKV